MLVAAVPVTATVTPAMRAFHQRAVRYLVAEAGVRQFLDTGIRLAMTDNTHQVAQSMAPGCRVVYVAHDPMVLSHARALLPSAADGAVASLDADLSDPRKILNGAAETLDLGRPVAILLMARLAYVTDDEAAAQTMLSLAGAVPSGSYVALCHHASDLDPAMPAAARRWNAMAAQPIKPRSRAQLTEMVAGLDLVPPGLVPITHWRPAPDDPRFDHAVPLHAFLARKP